VPINTASVVSHKNSSACKCPGSSRPCMSRCAVTADERQAQWRFLHAQAIRNIAHTLVPGSGKVFFRDYAENDLAAARLHKVPGASCKYLHAPRRN
jgi:hypothetical protein